MSDHRFAAADRYKPEQISTPSAVGRGLGMLAAFGLLDDIGLGDTEDDVTASFAPGAIVLDLSAQPHGRYALLSSPRISRGMTMSEFRFTVTVGDRVEAQVPFAQSPSVGIAVLSALGLDEEISMIDQDDETNTPSIEIDPQVFEQAQIDGTALNGRSLPSASLWAVDAAWLALRDKAGQRPSIFIDVAPSLAAVKGARHSRHGQARAA